MITMVCCACNHGLCVLYIYFPTWNQHIIYLECFVCCFRCKCQHCIAMPTDQECRCCCELKQVMTLFLVLVDVWYGKGLTVWNLHHMSSVRTSVQTGASVGIPSKSAFWLACYYGCIFWLTFRSSLCYGFSLSVCLCNTRDMYLNGWTDQDSLWHGGSPRPWAHCVRWGSWSWP